MPSPDAGPSADLVACRARLAAGSKSFAAAARLLPPEVRDAATALYAFCRDADDAVDLGGGGLAAVDGLSLRLDRIFAGNPLPHAPDRALTEVVWRYALPRTPLDALLEGFAWDAERRRYATLADLEAYCARVAGTVGAMMALLMGARGAATLARACELGVAMQLTNIARDVGEDARAGRLYLPLDWLEEAGVEPAAFLAAPKPEAGVRAVTARLLEAADRLYARVDSGVAQLPAACRPGINAARYIYADIGRIVRAAGCDSVTRRAVVGRGRKLLLLAKAFCSGAREAVDAGAPALAATAFLVDAIAAAPSFGLRRPELAPALPWWDLRARGLWLIELFERLERERRGLLPGEIRAGNLSAP